MLGVANGTVTLRNTEIPYYYRWEAIAGFVQNDWKVKRNLTLNLGVRYSLQMPRTEKYDNQGVFRPGSGDVGAAADSADADEWRGDQVGAGAGRSRSAARRQLAYLTPPDYRDFEPRFGFAWSPTAAAVAPPDAARRLWPVARAGDRRDAVAESGFRRHLGLCHARCPRPRRIRTT